MISWVGDVFSRITATVSGEHSRWTAIWSRLSRSAPMGSPNARTTGLRVSSNCSTLNTNIKIGHITNKALKNNYKTNGSNSNCIQSTRSWLLMSSTCNSGWWHKRPSIAITSAAVPDSAVHCMIRERSTHIPLASCKCMLIKLSYIYYILCDKKYLFVDL